MTRRQPHGHPANSTKYKRLRAEFMRKQGRSGLCALCGGQVDMSLSGRTAFGPSVDHIQATSAGGDWFDPTNWQLAHLRCNNQKGRGEALGDGRQRSAIPSPYDPANPPPGCTCRPTTTTPKSPNDIYCDVCEAVIRARRARHGE